MKILKIKSLPSKTWIDRDKIMLHACFQILKDCVEKEHVDTQCCYITHKKVVDEIRFLYDWWIERKKNDKVADEQIEEDNKMLIRLIKIRGFLWT